MFEQEASALLASQVSFQGNEVWLWQLINNCTHDNDDNHSRLPFRELSYPLCQP